MVETLTAHYSWTKPEVTKSASTWGGFLNNDLDAIDAQVFTNQQALGNYLPLAGGALTGPLNGTTVTATGNVSGVNWIGGGAVFPNYGATTTGYLSASATATTMCFNPNTYVSAQANNIYLSAAGALLTFSNSGLLSCASATLSSDLNVVGNTFVRAAIYPSSATTSSQYYLSASSTTRSITWLLPWGLNWRTSDGLMYFQSPTGTVHQWTGAGDYTLGAAGQGYKSGGGPWASTSDERTKKDIRPYQSGLDQILQINPVAFRYNGQGGTDTSDKVYYGVVAQAVKPVMPELVIDMDRPRHSVEDGSVLPRLATMLEGQLGTDLGPLTLALVNAVKTLAARVAELEAR